MSASFDLDCPRRLVRVAMPCAVYVGALLATAVWFTLCSLVVGRDVHLFARAVLSLVALFVLGEAVWLANDTVDAVRARHYSLQKPRLQSIN